MFEETDPRVPFINVHSKGGDFEDTAYAAGYEMGILDMSLAITNNAVIDIVIHTKNETQADLIAMRHDWTMESIEKEDGYSYVRFMKNLTVIGERFLLEKEFNDEDDDRDLI